MVDVETDRWAAAVLNKLMDADLKSDISSTLEEHPTKQRGAVVVFCLIAKRIFERYQETKVAMMEYLTSLTFVIRIVSMFLLLPCVSVLSVVPLARTFLLVLFVVSLMG